MKNKIQIEFIQNNKVIQTKPFKLVIRVENIDNVPFSGATIKDIQIRSANNQQIIEPIEKEFHIGEINPGQNITIEMGRVGTYMHGLANIKFVLVPDKIGTEIITYQKNNFTGELFSGGINDWTDFFYIRTIDEYTRDKTNNILLIITVIMAVMAAVQIYLAKKQIDYAMIQSIPEQINQAKAKQDALTFCKENPESLNSGLYKMDGSGAIASCGEVMMLNK